MARDSMTRTRRQWKALWCCTAALFLSGCSALSGSYREVEESIARGDHLAAIEGVRKNADLYGEKSAVLYHLDLGITFHYAGETDSSITHLLAAERIMDELFTKSVSLEVASLLLNDNVLPYEGEDFEKALVNVFLALDFARAGEDDEALVEARKADLKLRELSRKYDDKNRYREDAFIRYIAGVLYENGGEPNEAFISYKKAYDTYRVYEQVYSTPVPSFLLDDLVRSATLTGFQDEANTYIAAGGKPFRRVGEEGGSLLLIAYAGKGPIKREVKSKVSIMDAEGTLHTFQLALPQFVPRNREKRVYTLHARGAASHDRSVSTRTEVAEDVTAIAAKSLEDRLDLIYLKSGGRAILKFLAAEKAKSELKKSKDGSTNFWGSILVDLALGATEQADLRTWRTLPAQFQLARLNLEPGEYDISVASQDGQYKLNDARVLIGRGRTTILMIDDLR